MIVNAFNVKFDKYNDRLTPSPNNKFNKQTFPLWFPPVRLPVREAPAPWEARGSRSAVPQGAEVSGRHLLDYIIFSCESIKIMIKRLNLTQRMCPMKQRFGMERSAYKARGFICSLFLLQSILYQK